MRSSRASVLRRAQARRRSSASRTKARLRFCRTRAATLSCGACSRGARELANAAEGEFLQALAACAGSRAGRALDVASRSVQPLALRVNRRSIGERAVYIGNAARTLHPVAGQGLNLGLRDAWDLAQIMRAASDPGDAGLLARFSTRRRVDARGAIYVTDALARAFVHSNPLFSAFAGAALTGLDIVPGPRRFFARRMIFGASALP